MLHSLRKYRINPDVPTVHEAVMFHSAACGRVDDLSYMIASFMYFKMSIGFVKLNPDGSTDILGSDALQEWMRKDRMDFLPPRILLCRTQYNLILTPLVLLHSVKGLYSF